MCEDMCDDCRFYENSPSKFPCSSCTCGKYFEPKEQPFEPEYFSGLNWRKALPLVGKMVEFSDNADEWHSCGTLIDVETGYAHQKRFKQDTFVRWEYIRTTPETHAHPTITMTVNGREWVLPIPETKTPKNGTEYYKWMPHGAVSHIWDDAPFERYWLDSGAIHLIESRTKAWADFWREAILGAVKEVKEVKDGL
jgi:hypothetical protein